MEAQQFVDNFAKAIKEDNAAIFAGAGLSRGAGFVNWKDLLRSIAEELHLHVDKEQHDLVSLAQFYYNEHNGRGQLNQIITDEFQRHANITENHKILARLPITTYWTSNYDTLIETALRDSGKKPDVKIEPENLAITLNDRDAIVYKMHGDVSQVHKAIITRDDYEKYEFTKRSLFTTALQGDLISKTFLFIGFSFNDPNLNYILSRIRVKLENNQRPHYCFLKKINRTDYQKLDDYEYDKIKQELQIKDLKRFAIHTILVDEYSQVTELLRRVEINFKRKSVFISGSAEEYGDFSEAEACDLLHTLSFELAKSDFRIVSGFGSGVGSYIINGALNYLHSQNGLKLETNLLLRPFPQKPSGGKSISELWTVYRRSIIVEAGIAIFLFGNKKDADTIVNADGMMEEFNIAKEYNVKIIPVSCTGFQARMIYKEIMREFDQYYPEGLGFRPLFEALDKRSSSSKIVGYIFDIIKLLKSNGIC